MRVYLNTGRLIATGGQIFMPALALAQADYGLDRAALMHLSAARRLGVVPRELAVAIVAVPKQRPKREVLGAMSSS